MSATDLYCGAGTGRNTSPFGSCGREFGIRSLALLQHTAPAGLGRGELRLCTERRIGTESWSGSHSISRTYALLLSTSALLVTGHRCESRHARGSATRTTIRAARSLTQRIHKGVVYARSSQPARHDRLGRDSTLTPSLVSCTLVTTTSTFPPFSPNRDSPQGRSEAPAKTLIGVTCDMAFDAMRGRVPPLPSFQTEIDSLPSRNV
jgi:hypothetical protein